MTNGFQQTAEETGRPFNFITTLTRQALLGLLVLSLTACGGDGGADTTMVYVPMYAPQQVTLVSSSEDSLTVSWSNAAVADSYKVYIASESITDTANISVFANSAEFDDVTSPYSISGLTTGTKYFILVTAMYGAHESVANNQLEATPLIAGRYLPINDDGSYNPDGTIIRDHVNYLDWQRCPVGMEWDSTAGECTGTAATTAPMISNNILQTTPTTTQFARPTIQQLLTLVYCDEQTFFNGETLDQACISSSIPSVYPGLFTGMPSDLIYGTQTMLVNTNTSSDGLYVDFSSAAVDVQYAATYFCNAGTVYYNHVGVAHYARLVRLVAKPE